MSRTWLLLAVLVMTTASARGEVSTANIQRDDGSSIRVSILQPASRAVGTVLYLSGSSCRAPDPDLGHLLPFQRQGYRVLVPWKRGASRGDPEDCTSEYRRFSTKQIRVRDSIQVLTSSLAQSPVLLIGESEGVDVGARVAALEPDLVTGVVLIGGGGWPQAMELLHLERSKLRLSGQSEHEVEIQLMEMKNLFRSIRTAPDSGKRWSGHTYRRWASYLFSPPSADLLMVDAPILMVNGDRDKSVPIQSARSVQAEFALARKKNLSFHVMKGVGHDLHDEQGNNRVDEMGQALFRWMNSTWRPSLVH